MALGDIVTALGPRPTLAQAPEAPLGPEAIRRRRLLAELMLKQGMDYSPIQSPWQGAARMAQALMGGIEQGMADKAERQGLASANAAVAKILGMEPGMGGGEAAAPQASGGGRSLPAFASDVTGGINAATAKYGLDPNFLPVTAFIESRGNPNAQNPNSSAGGLFQFINGTARQYGLQNKFDPEASADAAARLALDNKKALVAALGREPTPAELYLAHQQGGGGAARLLANPDAPAAAIVGERAVRLNGGAPGMTAGEFANKWISKFNSVRVPGTQVASTAPSAMTLGYNPAFPVGASAQPYDPNAQPQSSLIQPAQQTAGLNIEAVPPQGMPAPAQQQPVQPGSLPSMAGGGQSMQMPGAGLQRPAAPQPMQAPQTPPDPTFDPGNPIRQQVTQQTARPEVQQAAQAAAQTPAGQQMARQAQGAPMAAVVQALSNPWISDGQKALLMMVLKERMERSDPMRQLQMLKLRQELQGGTPEEQELRRLKLEGERLGLNRNREMMPIEMEAKKAEIDAKRVEMGLPPLYSQPGSAQGGQAPAFPPPPPGVDAKTYRQKMGEKAASDALPPDSKDVSALRKEIQDIPSYKNIAQAAPVYKSMAKAAGRDNRAADVNLIYGLAKIMDPGSVVRESEMTIAQAIATLPQQLQNTIASQLQSTGRLSPEIRAQIMEEAHTRIEAYNEMFQQDAGMFRGIVERRRMDPRDVIPDFGAFEPWRPPAKPAGSSSFGFGGPAPQAVPNVPAGQPTREEAIQELKRRGKL